MGRGPVVVSALWAGPRHRLVGRRIPSSMHNDQGRSAPLLSKALRKVWLLFVSWRRTMDAA